MALVSGSGCFLYCLHLLEQTILSDFTNCDQDRENDILEIKHILTIKWLCREKWSSTVFILLSPLRSFLVSNKNAFIAAISNWRRFILHQRWRKFGSIQQTFWGCKNSLRLFRPIQLLYLEVKILRDRLCNWRFLINVFY